MREDGLRVDKLLLTNDAGYVTITFGAGQMFIAPSGQIWKLLFIDMEIIQETDKIFAFLETLRRLNRCKVVVLSKSEFYPLIQEGRLKIDHLIDNIIFYPLSKEELTGDARRYLGL